MREDSCFLFGNTEECIGVFGGLQTHFLRGEAFELRDFLCYQGDQAAVIPSASVGFGSHVGAIGLNQDPINGNSLNSLQGAASILKGDHTRKAQIPASIYQPTGQICTAGEAVEDPTQIRVPLDDGHCILRSLTHVDDHREL